MNSGLGRAFAVIPATEPCYVHYAGAKGEFLDVDGVTEALATGIVPAGEMIDAPAHRVRVIAWGVLVYRGQQDTVDDSFAVVPITYDVHDCRGMGDADLPTNYLGVYDDAGHDWTHPGLWHDPELG